MRTFKTCCILFSLLALPFQAHAGKTYLFVGTTFPLILENGPNNEPIGTAPDILKLVSDITGDHYEIQIVPWPRALVYMKEGRAAGIIGPYLTTERQEFIDFTQSHFYEDRMVFLKEANSRTEWNGNFDHIRDKSILTIKGWAYGAHFNENRPDLRIIETIDPLNALKILKNGRVDLLAFNERNAKSFISQLHFENDIIISQPHFSINRGYFGFSKIKNETLLQQKFNAALNLLAENGALKSLNEQYGLTFHNK
jgi:polar amino acid transport system substrate-binding protein